MPTADPASRTNRTGTAYFGGICPGKPSPGCGPGGNVANPPHTRLTGASLRCNTVLGCGATAVCAGFSFIAHATAPYRLNFDMVGTGSANQMRRFLPASLSFASLIVLSLAAFAIGQERL